ncbi:hypothetical protein [Streptomyces sp. IB201691-2A2]|uniref:hypothetical protein n=1 Tax=Streptomyces sp. IB201691-2A2 TaxID=2561920 RepID=UPI00117EDEF8|nr:hypothetical protein [Streptomyces sp. IB201691-2A2]TRO55508.1 hypothetical protein E4K73_50345 [Streptomyces sp. IB201691-2A2]
MRLNLPVQGMIERRWNTYVPYLEVVDTYKTEEDPNILGDRVEEPPPASHFGTDVGDPAPWAGRDSRGWHCQPGSGCSWTGLV